MKRLILAAGMAAALALAGCETATPYQPLNLPGSSASGGYSDIRLEPNRFRVTFRGNSLTSRETVETYLLYRAAELTLQNGYDWFEIADRATETNTRTYANPTGPAFVYGGYWGPRWRLYRRGAWGYWDPFFDGPIDYTTVTQYETSAEIVMGQGPKPAGDMRAFDARQVQANLAGRIQRPQG